MNVLNKVDFLKKKKSNGIVIWGSGWSINEITNQQKDKLKRFDSIGFNWFCFSKIQTTYYLIREQANIPKRISPGETVDRFFNIMNKSYVDSCKIVMKIPQPHVYPWWNRVDIRGDAVILNDLKYGGPTFYGDDIFDHGVHHGSSTMCNILHIVRWLKYSKIIFAGVDLYDSRYFWLKNDERRETIVKKRKQVTDKHAIANNTIDLIKEFRAKCSGVRLYTANSKSLVTPLCHGTI